MYENVRQHLSKAPCFYELQGDIDIPSINNFFFLSIYHFFGANADLISRDKSKDPAQFMGGSYKNFSGIKRQNKS